MGGLAGHMMHPHDNLDLKIKQFLDLCIGSLSGQFKFSEKVDGFNIHILKYTGELRFARNATNLAQGGFNIDDMGNMFTNDRVRSIFKWAWKEMMQHKEKYLEMLPEFTENPTTLNVEVVHGTTNIIPYSISRLIPHNYQSWTQELGKFRQVGSPKNLKNSFRAPYNPVPYNHEMIRESLMDIFRHYGLTEEHTLRDYYRIKFIEVFKESAHNIYLISFSYPGIRAIFNRFFKDGDQTNLREIRKMFIHNIDPILMNEKWLVGKTKKELDTAVLKIGTMILENVKCLNEEHKYKACETLERKIKSLECPDPIQMDRWKALDCKIFPLEGVVVEYDGNLYKWTGPFAPINQMLGGIR